MPRAVLDGAVIGHLPPGSAPLDGFENRSGRFLAETGYGIDVSALRARYPEVAWSCFADWASELAPATPAKQTS